MLKRIVTIQDISCFGKCSLTVAHPILCAMGLETAVIPTAVLSTHTYQFKDYTFRDLTSDIPAIATHWKSLNLQFNGIYTGYLGSTEQVQIVSDFFDTFRNEHTSIIVDPVMGDAGKLYAGFTADFVQKMKALCKKADIIAPNMTEAALLLDRPYRTDYTEAEIQELLKKLTDLGAPTVVRVFSMQTADMEQLPMTANPTSIMQLSETTLAVILHTERVIFSAVCFPVRLSREHRWKRQFLLRST